MQIRIFASSLIVIEQKATIKTKLTITTTRRHKVENSKRSQMHLSTYNVFSVRVRAFVPLSAPCGVRVRLPPVLSGTKTVPSRVQCVFAV